LIVLQVRLVLTVYGGELNVLVVRLFLSFFVSVLIVLQVRLVLTVCGRELNVQDVRLFISFLLVF
jgi:hypothetical protein